MQVCKGPAVSAACTAQVLSNCATPTLTHSALALIQLKQLLHSLGRLGQPILLAPRSFVDTSFFFLCHCDQVIFAHVSNVKPSFVSDSGQPATKLPDWLHVPGTLHSSQSCRVSRGSRVQLHKGSGLTQSIHESRLPGCPSTARDPVGKVNGVFGDYLRIGTTCWCLSAPGSGSLGGAEGLLREGGWSLNSSSKKTFRARFSPLSDSKTRPIDCIPTIEYSE